MKKRIMKNSLWAFFVFSFTAAYSQDYLSKVDTVRNLIIDQQILVGELFLYPQKGEIEGKFTLIFETLNSPVDSVWLDAPNIDFLEVLFDGKSVRHKVLKRGVCIFPKITMNPHELHKITYHYKAQPRKGMYFMGWDDDDSGRKQVWTQGQGIDNRHWLPMVDDQNDKLLWDVTLSFDSDFLVLSNGERIEEKEIEPGIKKWRYSVKKPMSPYLIMLGVGKYSGEDHLSKSEVPLENYLYPDQEDRRLTTYYKSTELFDWMESLLTPFPWEKYSQIPVRDFHHGAMENTSATIFGDFYVQGKEAAFDKPYLEINAHELAHQWFGNWQTSTNATHHWLHEGFATYFQWEAVRVFIGEELYRDRLEEARSLVYSAEKQDDFPLCHPKAGSYRFYQKGGWVITMLANKLGHENFYKTLREYLLTDHMTNKTTDEFFEIAEKNSGLDLENFKNYWCYGHEVGEVTLRVEGDEVVISAIHIPESGIEVNLRFFQEGKSNEKVITVYPNQNHVEKLPAGTQNVILFPGKQTLFKVFENKPQTMWSFQMENALPLDEEIAFLKITSNEEVGFSDQKDIIIQVLTGDYDVRTQRMAAMLAGQLYPNIELENWFYSVRPSVREAFVVKELKIESKDFEFFLQALQDSSELEVRAYTKLLGSLDAQEVFDLTKDIEPSADGTLFYIRTMSILNADNKNQIFNSWVEKSSAKHSFLVRQTAFEILNYFEYYPDEFVYNLVQASSSSNRRLRNFSRKILQKIDEEKAQEQVLLYFENHPDIANWRKLWFKKTFDLDL